jgi:hypothetical protein
LSQIIERYDWKFVSSSIGMLISVAS